VGSGQQVFFVKALQIAAGGLRRAITMGKYLGNGHYAVLLKEIYNNNFTLTGKHTHPIIELE